MNLADLHIFRTVVEAGGVARAAARLHRVPSNVSTRIRQLEQSLGRPLFQRIGRRLELSADGELLLGYAERLLALADEARGVFSGEAIAGTLRIGALESTTASRLPALLVAFHARHPDVRLELVTGTNDALVRQLEERRIDAAFTAEVPGNEEFVHLPAFDERLVLATSEDHAPVSGPRDVAGDTLLAFPSGCAYRRIFERWLGRRRAPALRILETSSYHAMLACVAAGAGIALLPESVLALSPTYTIRRHALPRVLSEISTPFVWRREQPRRAIGAMADVLREIGRQPGIAG